MLDVRAAGLEHVIGGLDPARGYSVQMATVDARGFGQFSEPVSLPAYNTRNGAGEDNLHGSRKRTLCP